MKKHDYDTLLIWSPTLLCNLNCFYCNFSQRIRLGVVRSFKLDLKHAKLSTLKETFKPHPLFAKEIWPRRVDIKKAIRTLNMAERKFLICITGGEPFLIPNIIEVCKNITERYHLALISNLTSHKLTKFVKEINPDRVTSIQASFHVTEFEKKNLMKKYIDNLLLCKENKFNIYAFMVGHPFFMDKVDKYRKTFGDRGIDIVFGPFNGTYKGKSYPDSYTEKEIKIFGLEKNIAAFKESYNQKGKLCNAGYNFVRVFNSGKTVTCGPLRRDMGNIYNEIYFKNELIVCPIEGCTCAGRIVEPSLYKKALIEKNKIDNI